MTFDPTIPQPGDLLSNSQQDLLDNFSQLNTQFGVDHTPFNTGSGNGDGFHKKVTFPSAPVIAAPTGTQSVAYPKVVNAIQELHFQNTTAETQITSSALVASAGAGFIPGGLQIRCGVGTATAGGNPIVYGTQFPTATLAVATSPDSSTQVAQTAGYLPTGFTATCSSGSISFHWVAVGY